MVIANSV